MRKFVFYLFLLSIGSMMVSAIMGYYTVTKISLLTFLFSGFTGFYLLVLHSYRVTSRATRKLKQEGMKAYTSINLFYKLEKLRLHQGARQFNAAAKKSKMLLRLIRQRIANNSLTQLRFQQEVEAYVRHVTQNLEQVVATRESVLNIDPKA